MKTKEGGKSKENTQMIHSSLLAPGTLAKVEIMEEQRQYLDMSTSCQPGKKALGYTAMCPLRTGISEKNDISDNDIFTQKQGIMEVFILQNGIKETQERKTNLCSSPAVLYRPYGLNTQHEAVCL